VELWELVAREHVRDTLARYNHAVDWGRSSDVAACFTEDGVLDVGSYGGRWDGPDRIAAELDAVAQRLALTGGSVGPVRHHVSSMLIRFPTQQLATVRSYFLVVTSIGPDHWGRYVDRLRPVETGWCFTERRVQIDGHAHGSVMVGGR
jgi:hypothetical protein